MATRDTVLEGCEILCLTGDLIACPLTLVGQRECKQRLQYQAGMQEVAAWTEANSSTCAVEMHTRLKRWQDFKREKRIK